ncbi:MAG: hypothetical protein NC311_09005 [Muribaculaceae bacterium]|nr:hypothetical protein [Muribaculaceae bacterium]
MLLVLGAELDFDVSAPDDVARYIAASQKMVEKSQSAPPLPEAKGPSGGGKTVEWMQEYQNWVEANCKLLTDWIDDVFGEGTANKLLGPKTSLDKILEIYDLLFDAVAKQGEAVGARLRQFMPNRRTGGRPG